MNREVKTSHFVEAKGLKVRQSFAGGVSAQLRFYRHLLLSDEDTILQ